MGSPAENLTDQPCSTPACGWPGQWKATLVLPCHDIAGGKAYVAHVPIPGIHCGACYEKATVESLIGFAAWVKLAKLIGSAGRRIERDAATLSWELA
jgi:hypothetical protein